MQNRCLKSELEIDRSIFYKMRDPKIYRSNDGIYRTIAKRDVTIYRFEQPDGINKLTNLSQNFNNDNMVNITSFETSMNWKDQQYQKYDISKQSRFYVQKGTFRRDWSLNSMVAKK